VISIPTEQRRNVCRALSSMLAMAVNSRTHTTFGTPQLAAPQPTNDALILGDDPGGHVR